MHVVAFPHFTGFSATLPIVESRSNLFFPFMALGKVQQAWFRRGKKEKEEGRKKAKERGEGRKEGGALWRREKGTKGRCREAGRAVENVRGRKSSEVARLEGRGGRRESGP